ncbi:MAG: glycosyltransferase family 4 protein [Patescibacteria group bacterium]|nr:glycosyltransferase family 4 protein [Patescibacteria group bacterium]
MLQVVVFDPTLKDKLSASRGIGRYLKILRENFPNWRFIPALESFNHLKNTSLKKKLVFLNPFLNLIHRPTFFRMARKQIAVIHDLIPLKYSTNFPFGVKGKIYLLLNRLSFKNYDLFITDSLASKEDLVKILKIPAKKIKVIYPCLPEIFLTSQTKSKKIPLDLQKSLPENFCLYVGDITWNKNLVNLARAIKIANVTGVFVGRMFDKETIKKNRSVNHPWLREYHQFLKETDGDKRFVFLGFLEDETLVEIYKKATINILPSRDEGFGFSFIEAGIFGCPSLLSDIQVFREISQAKLEKSLAFFDPEDPNDLADKIIQVYFSKKNQKKLGNQAKMIAKNYSQEKFRQSFYQIIDEMF